MNERGLKVLEQYDFKVLGTRRGRSSFLCDTDQGLKLITEFQGTGKRLGFQNVILNKIREQGYPLVDRAVENAKGELVTKDKDDTSYVVKDWFEGRECDTKNEEEILASVRNLARIHKMMHLPGDELQESYIGEKLGAEYLRRNREIKKVYTFVQERRKKNAFESCYLKTYFRFMEQAFQAVKELEQSDYETLYEQEIRRGSLCHGDYNQHQVLFTKKGIATTNFTKCKYDVQVGDLYHFMRKILEKQNWNPRIGRAMLAEYDRQIPLKKEELQYLKIRLIYPEKFWKLANYYYNHKKAWVSEKSTEKLQILIAQEQKREAFLKILDL